MSYVKRALRVGVLVFVVALSFSAPVAAQQLEQKFIGLIIRTPAEYKGFTYEFFMNKGEKKCDYFIAQHDFQTKDKSATYYTIASDLEIDPNTRRPYFPKNEFYLDHPFSLARWVTFDQTQVTLPYWGYEQRINFCVTVPADAAPGSHYAVLLMSNITKDQYLDGADLLPETGAALGSRLGVNLIVNVGGKLEKNIGIKSLSVLDIDYQPGLFNIFEYLPLNIVALLSNEGNQFAKPAGNITIHQGDLSKPAAIFPFNPGATRILPNTDYDFTTTWSDAPLYIYQQTSNVDGKNSVDYKLGIDLNKLGNFRFGRYYATLQLTYYDINGDFKRLPDYTVEFWVIPWKLLAVPIIIGGLYIWYRVRKYRKGGKAHRDSKQPRKLKKTNIHD